MKVQQKFQCPSGEVCIENKVSWGLSPYHQASFLHSETPATATFVSS